MELFRPSLAVPVCLVRLDSDRAGSASSIKISSTRISNLPRVARASKVFDPDVFCAASKYLNERPNVKNCGDRQFMPAKRPNDLFRVKRAWLSGVACALLTFVGCSEATTVPAEGLVILDGVPLAGIGIKFVPASDSKWLGDPIYNMPWAITDAQGRFRMVHGVSVGSYTSSSVNKKLGVQPGKYKVVLSRYPAISRALISNAPAVSADHSARETPTSLSRLEWEWLKNPKREVLALAEFASPEDIGAIEAGPLPAASVPARFLRAETSTLSASVRAGGRTDLRFEISSEAER